ncbi:MAG: hypothetical protein ACLUD2_13655 [Clostridium sp.]
MSWKAMELALSWQYLMPQVGQNSAFARRKAGTNLSVTAFATGIQPHRRKAGSPAQLIIFVTLSMTTLIDGCKISIPFLRNGWLKMFWA